MLQINNITFGYTVADTSRDVLLYQDFCLNVAHGEFVTLLGKSGCGKSTLVNLIAGYIQPTEGFIQVNNELVKKPGRDRVIIHQENDLFDWMTVYENMKLVSKDVVAIDSLLQLTNLYEFRMYYPHELSGGMKKRLSLARALVVRPGCIIMDEPFSSLDIQMKSVLYQELLRIIKKMNMTVILVTHDIDEALALSDRVIVLSGQPVKIKEDLSIQFNNNLDSTTKQSSDFIQMRQYLQGLLMMNMELL